MAFFSANINLLMQLCHIQRDSLNFNDCIPWYFLSFNYESLAHGALEEGSCSLFLFDLPRSLQLCKTCAKATRN